MNSSPSPVNRSSWSRSTVVKPPVSSPRRARAEDRVVSARWASTPAWSSCSSSRTARVLSRLASGPLPMPSHNKR